MGYSVLVRKGDDFPDSRRIQPFAPSEWETYPFADREKLRWFREAKLGLFLTVGLSALGKADLSWSRKTHGFPDPGEGTIPDDVYDGWSREIRMERFCAEEWVDLAVRGGFRYLVIIAKHHDGFHMWDTAYSDYKITNAPMGRDYLGELIDACRKAGMPVGLYYSQRDWHHPDYAPVDPDLAVRQKGAPLYRMKGGLPVRPGKRHPHYVRFLHDSVRELMQKYGKIDILWWDSWWCKGTYTKEMWDTPEIERQVRALQPGILINNRGGVPGDFDTPEGFVGFVQRQRPWETCMPMGSGWSWTGADVKPFRQILHQFLQTVAGDGNYLLSIGSMPDGRIAAEEAGRILALGDWLRKWGDTVYKTRSGPWNPGEYGGSVYRGDTVFLHLLNAPEGKTLHFPLAGCRVVETEVLTGERAAVEICGNVLSVTLPEGVFDDIILRIRMRDPVTVPAEGINAE